MTLQAKQTQNVPITLAVDSNQAIVNVDTTAPLLDTAETRTELTLHSQALSRVSITGHNMISLVTYAPGVVGTGATGNQTTGSAGDKYAPENQVSASANGCGSVGNHHVVDTTTANIRPVFNTASPYHDNAIQISEGGRCLRSWCGHRREGHPFLL